MEKSHNICERYCPVKKKNVVLKVYYGETGPYEECMESPLCAAEGGCKNTYLKSAENLPSESQFL